jgi:hypothetical protein
MGHRDRQRRMRVSAAAEQIRTAWAQLSLRERIMFLAELAEARYARGDGQTPVWDPASALAPEAVLPDAQSVFGETVAALGDDPLRRALTGPTELLALVPEPGGQP